MAALDTVMDDAKQHCSFFFAHYFLQPHPMPSYFATLESELMCCAC